MSLYAALFAAALIGAAAALPADPSPPVYPTRWMALEKEEIHETGQFPQVRRGSEEG